MIAATALKIIVDRFPPNTQSGRCAVSPSRLGLQPPSRLKTCFRTLLQGSHLAYSCYSSGLPCPLSSLLRAPSAYFLFLITHSLLIITFIFLSLFGLFLLRVSCHHHLMAYIYTLFFFYNSSLFLWRVQPIVTSLSPLTTNGTPPVAYETASANAARMLNQPCHSCVSRATSVIIKTDGLHQQRLNIYYHWTKEKIDFFPESDHQCRFQTTYLPLPSIAYDASSFQRGPRRNTHRIPTIVLQLLHNDELCKKHLRQAPDLKWTAVSSSTMIGLYLYILYYTFSTINSPDFLKIQSSHALLLFVTR